MVSINRGLYYKPNGRPAGCIISTVCTQGCWIDSSSLKSFTNHRTAMQSKVQAFHAPCKMLQPWPPWKREGVEEPAEVRGQPSLLQPEPLPILPPPLPAKEREGTCCPLVFAPHHLGEAELIHANLRRINLIQLLRFYSAQSAAQLPCEVISYLYTISLEILNSDQMVPCSHKLGFHYLILF